jgi:hypothetical protein
MMLFAVKRWLRRIAAIVHPVREQAATGRDRYQLVELRRRRRIGPRPRSFWRRVWLLGLIAATVAAVAAVLWAAVAEPSWLLPDTRGLSPADRVKAQTDFRNTAVTLLGGLAVLVGGAVGAANLVLSQRVQWRAQVTDRFSKAIEQLGQQGPEKLDIRIGAVYALEQIARDSEELHWPIMEVLTAYLRQHASGSPDVDAPLVAAEKRLPADHQAIATVIGRRRQRDPLDQRLDLHGTSLPGVGWREAHLEQADLTGAYLTEANLTGAHLEEADLNGAHLERAYLEKADLRGAILRMAHLKGADLAWANLEGADFAWANLEGAVLVGANLERVALNERAGLPRELASRLDIAGYRDLSEPPGGA